MNGFNMFREMVKRELPHYLPADVAGALEMHEIDVVKKNDQKFHGLALRVQGKQAAPTFYLDDAYAAYQMGFVRKEKILADLADLYVRCESDSIRDDVEETNLNLSWESVRDNLIVRLLGESRNTEFLKNVPYQKACPGLALIAEINQKTPEGGWSSTITYQILEQLGVGADTLFETAMKNAPETEPAMLSALGGFIGCAPGTGNLLERGESDGYLPEDMYILTNEEGVHGAGTIMYPGIAERIAELFGCDYYVIPSSIHEMLIVPKKLQASVSDLKETIRNANSTVVDESDILSDELYCYSREKNAINIA